MFSLYEMTEISTALKRWDSSVVVVVIIIGTCQLEQLWNVFGAEAQTRNH